MKINNKTIEKNKSIKFNEKLHKYYIDKKELISVSTIIHKYFPKFDSKKISLELAKGNKEEQKKLLKDWSIRTETGTSVHYYLEQYAKTGEEPTNEDIKKLGENLGTTYENIKLRFMGGKQFIEDMKNKGWTPFIPEWQVWSTELGIAGTIDIPFINNKGQIFLGDYKCTKRIYKQSFPKSVFSHYDDLGCPVFKKVGESGLEPVKHLDNCNFNLYSLQLSMYKYIIEKEYGYEVVGNVLVHLPPNSSRYIKYEVDDLKSEVLEIINQHKEDEHK